jgi:uncharacterized protein
MRILISGKSGFIGSRLSGYFEAKGYKVEAISRKDFEIGVDHLASKLDGSDVIINLAGAPIIKRWTRKYSKILWDSRILTTRTLVNAIAATDVRPKVFLSASAVGIYADGGKHTENEHVLDEDFLGILCRRWEEEALRARIHTHTMIMRTGIVLGRDGGALKKMELPYRFFVGGKIGSGRQMMSWIHIDDYARAVDWLIEKSSEKNIFNFTSPNPVSNTEFSEQLARQLNRPNLFTVPPFALQAIYGEGSVALLSGQEVLPENLLSEGFRFKHENLQQALDEIYPASGKQ